MTKRERLLRSRDYIISRIQLNLLNLIGNYKDKKKLKDYELAKQLKVSKGYVSQVLNATYDHKISKVADLSLACNSVPLMYFVDIDEFVKNDAEGKVYELIPVMKPKAISYQSQISSFDFGNEQTFTTDSYSRLSKKIKLETVEASGTN